MPQRKARAQPRPTHTVLYKGDRQIRVSVGLAERLTSDPKSGWSKNPPKKKTETKEEEA